MLIGKGLASTIKGPQDEVPPPEVNIYKLSNVLMKVEGGSGEKEGLLRSSSR